MDAQDYQMNKEEPQQLQEAEVEIERVAQSTNGILVHSEYYDGWLTVIPPAKVSFAKAGKATIKMNADGKVVFVRMANANSGYSKPSYNGGYKKPYNPIKPASQYVPKKEVKLPTDVLVFSGITLEEFSKKYSSVQKVGRIVASRTTLVPTEQLKDGEVEKATGKNGKRLYDVEIYYEISPQLKETQSEELPDY